MADERDPPRKHERTEIGGSLDHVLEYSIGVDVDEASVSEVVVELVDEGLELVVEYLAGNVDPLDAGGSVGAVLGQLIWAASYLTHSDQSHLPCSIVVQRLQSKRHKQRHMWDLENPENVQIGRPRQ